MQRRTKPLIWIVAALAVFVTALWQQRAEFAPEAPSTHATVPVAVEQQKWSRVQEVVPAGEREQLLATLMLIDRGGPYPYKKDGSTFANRETQLPLQPRGYYREYTVPTPGESDRGARRVVQGREGDTWYTSDHYKTFVRIDR
ncbi:MAG TPA: ribonuclease domain-containing protein [Thermoanaerobaculia bacterium]|nr:ribonuclease domain-containing protein [Thermoanaerobaculia bacterium]